MAGIFTICTFLARMYDAYKWEAYLKRVLYIGSGYLLITAAVTWVIATIYAYRMEANLNEGNT